MLTEVAREAADKKAAADRYARMHAQGAFSSGDLVSLTRIQARRRKRRRIWRDCRRFAGDATLPRRNELLRQRVRPLLQSSKK